MSHLFLVLLFASMALYWVYDSRGIGEKGIGHACFFVVMMVIYRDSLFWMLYYLVLYCIMLTRGGGSEMMTWAQLGLQDAASPVMEEFIFFHDFTMVVLVFIVSFVGYIMTSMMSNSHVNTGLLEGQMVECVWTLMPAVVLIQIAVPSLLLLYMLDETISCGLTIKAVGHQWYWSYEYSDFWRAGAPALEFDAYMLPLAESAKNGFRLLDVDNRTAVPWGVHARVLVSSADVLHSWAVPALGVKADACPGRLNQVKFLGHRPGVVYGQCSEICGANHSFMPIAVELSHSSDFLTWVETNL